MLNINKLSIAYNQIETVSDISLTVNSGEIVGIVGESGSGKSTLLKSILSLLPGNGKVTKGEILFDNQDLLTITGEKLRNLRGNEISMIFQLPELYFDPIYTIENQFIECVKAHCDTTNDKANQLAIEILSNLNFSKEDIHGILKSYPFELSGGMCQRVAIAMAMANRPKLLLADEPTSALDVTVQSQVAQSMVNLKEKYGTSILMVTHNMGLVAYMADTVGVMHKGKLVEWGTKEDVLFNPTHPYTKRLIESIPKMPPWGNNNG